MGSNTNQITHDITGIPVTSGSDIRQQMKVDCNKGCIWRSFKYMVGLFHRRKRGKHLPPSPKKRSPIVNFLSWTRLKSKQPAAGIRFKEAQRISCLKASHKSPTAIRSQSTVYVDHRQDWLWNLQGLVQNERVEPLVQNWWRILRRQQPGIKSSVGPFWAATSPWSLLWWESKSHLVVMEMRVLGDGGLIQTTKMWFQMFRDNW